MNKGLIVVFVIISTLSIGAILVYANNKKLLTLSGGQINNSQVLSAFSGPNDSGRLGEEQQSALNQGLDQNQEQSQQSQTQAQAQNQEQQQAQVKDQMVTDSSTNSNTTMTEVKELKIEDEKIGDGAEVRSGDTVEVNYLGTLLNGQKFDSSYDRNQAFSFTVGAGNVIKGWDQGLLGMKVGGKRKLTIPSDLAYGAQGAGGMIEPNTPLVFEIELVSIK